MRARDDYPRMFQIAGDRLHNNAGLYEADGREILAALDEIDRLRRPWSEEDCNNRLREIASGNITTGLRNLGDLQDVGT